MKTKKQLEQEIENLKQALGLMNNRFENLKQTRFEEVSMLHNQLSGYKNISAKCTSVCTKTDNDGNAWYQVGGKWHVLLANGKLLINGEWENEP